MAATRSRKRSRSRFVDVVQKPKGVIHPRVQQVGPEHFEQMLNILLGFDRAPFFAGKQMHGLILSMPARGMRMSPSACAVLIRRYRYPAWQACPAVLRSKAKGNARHDN